MYNSMKLYEFTFSNVNRIGQRSLTEFQNKFQITNNERCDGIPVPKKWSDTALCYILTSVKNGEFKEKKY
jgi:hypothetical protein